MWSTARGLSRRYGAEHKTHQLQVQVGLTPFDPPYGLTFIW